VFLHRETGEEYALARTERKHGRGYRGFEFFASPDVSLAEDLARRDLTINAMARDEHGTLIDPFGGEADLRAGVLRHVSPAFVEDPLRVLRVARFAARFGFAVAPETARLMRKLVATGELAELSPERVWQELSRGLMAPIRRTFSPCCANAGRCASSCRRWTRSTAPERARGASPAEPARALIAALEYAAQARIRVTRALCRPHRPPGQSVDSRRARHGSPAHCRPRGFDRRKDRRAAQGAARLP
jgi:hypothetical protein